MQISEHLFRHVRQEPCESSVLRSPLQSGRWWWRESRRVEFESQRNTRAARGPIKYTSRVGLPGGRLQPCRCPPSAAVFTLVPNKYAMAEEPTSAPTIDDLRVRLCYICRDEEAHGDPAPRRWVHPCSCTLIAHESCLLHWIRTAQSSTHPLSSSLRQTDSQSSSLGTSLIPSMMSPVIAPYQCA